MMLKKVTDNRVVSSFFISIGTALALESLFDPKIDPYDKERKVVKIDATKYTKHYFNALTLIRNIVSSIDTVNKEVLFNDRHVNTIILNTLIQELYVIKELYSDIKCNPIIFIPNYKALNSNLLPKKRKVPPSRRELLDDISNSVLQLLVRFAKDNKLPIDSEGGSHHLSRSSENILITTHVSVDLLNYTRLPNLHLLESYTGVLKDKRKFNTKLPAIGKADTSRLPFTEDIVYVLGDSILSRSRNIRIKRELLRVAEISKWNPLTAASTVRFAISKMHDEDGKNFKFKKLY